MSRLNPDRIKGQSLLEFLMGITTVSISLILGAYTLQAGWQRSRCAYITFEKTHEALTGAKRISANVQINENEQEISGVGHCGDVEEKISFKKL